MYHEMINILGILIAHRIKENVDWGWIIPRRCPFLCPKLFNLFQFVSTRKLFLPLNFLITVGLVATNWLQTFYWLKWKLFVLQKKAIKSHKTLRELTKQNKKKFLCLNFAATEENCLHGSWLKVRTHLTAKAHTHTHTHSCWCT